MVRNSKTLDYQVNLCGLEADGFYTEVELRLGQILELFSKESLIPDRIGAELVVGDRKSDELRWGEMLKPDDRNE